MCRNIKTLANFEPPATGDEIRASALQFVRKLSGMNKPSRANEAAFNRAVEEVTEAAHRLIASITTSAPPRIARRKPQSAGARPRAIRLKGSRCSDVASPDNGCGRQPGGLLARHLVPCG